MNMNKVSVIIPVFNVEKYLKRCIESVINQTYKELEIILIDDGSTDSSGLLCDQYAKEDSRIIVIHKINSGSGYARNSGLEIMTGYYVAFFDSDDWIDSNAIEVMVQHAQEYQADMIICGFHRYINDNNITDKKATDVIKVYTDKEEIINKVLYPIMGADVKKNSGDHEMCVWTNLYTAKILRDNDIKFVSEREYLSEDFFFNIEYIMSSKCAVIVPEIVYYYRLNTISLSNGFRPNKIPLLNSMTQEAYKILDRYNIREGAGFRLEKSYLKRLRNNFMIIESCSKLKRKDKLSEFKKIVRTPFTQLVFKDYPVFAGPLKEVILILLIKFKLHTLTYYYLKMQRIILKTLRSYKNLRGRENVRYKKGIEGNAAV